MRFLPEAHTDFLGSLRVDLSSLFLSGAMGERSQWERA